MRRPHEETVMDVMGRLLYYVVITAIAVMLLAAYQPLLILPVLLLAVVVWVVFHEAKVPLGPPKIGRRAVAPPPRRSYAMSAGPYGGAAYPMGELGMGSERVFPGNGAGSEAEIYEDQLP